MSRNTQIRKHPQGVLCSAFRQIAEQNVPAQCMQHLTVDQVGRYEFLVTHSVGVKIKPSELHDHACVHDLHFRRRPRVGTSCSSRSRRPSSIASAISPLDRCGAPNSRRPARITSRLCQTRSTRHAMSASSSLRYVVSDLPSASAASTSLRCTSSGTPRIWITLVTHPGYARCMQPAPNFRSWYPLQLLQRGVAQHEPLQAGAFAEVDLRLQTVA